MKTIKKQLIQMESHHKIVHVRMRDRKSRCEKIIMIYKFKQQLPGHFSVTNYVNKPKCQLHHPNKRLSSYAVEPIRLYLTRVSKLQSLNCSLETTKSKLEAQKVISSHSRLKTTKLSSDSQNN